MRLLRKPSKLTLTLPMSLVIAVNVCASLEQTQDQHNASFATNTSIKQHVYLPFLLLVAIKDHQEAYLPWLAQQEYYLMLQPTQEPLKNP